MKDVVDRARDVDKLCDIVLENPKSRMIREMAQVCRCAGNQVVDRENFPALLEEPVAQVRPKKSRSSRDYRAQWDGLFISLAGGWRFFMISYSPAWWKLEGA